MAQPRVRKRMIGEMLVEGGVITEVQLQQALEEQKHRGGRLGMTLRRLGYLTEETMIQFLGAQLGVPHVDLKTTLVDPEVATLIPEIMARRHQAIPIQRQGNELTLCMADPLNVYAIDDIRRATGLEVLPVVSTEEDVLRAIERYYTVSEAMAEVIRGVKEEAPKAAVEPLVAELESMAEETPVVRLVNMMITQAVRDRASDIHVEPEADIFRIRYRVDGLLREVMTPPRSLLAGLVSRLKILADMDIAEKRISQDGRFEMTVGGRTLDIRMATLPTLFGEKVVMRLLDKSMGLVPLEDLGLGADMLAEFERLIHRPYGFVLVTGPTGSGKTTTLYAALSSINSMAKNIITIEDPVEYQLPVINQVPVNPKAGVTFANGLRSILRQDPDIILVGEIRDRETAAIAIQAALTGHLVFSTLHTNDAAGAVARLADMGVEPFLVASSLLGVLAQRLVRRVCPQCKETYTAEPELLRELGMDSASGGSDPTAKTIEFARGRGCPECRETSYQGRVGIFELLHVTEPIRRLIVSKASSAAIREQGRRMGFRSLREAGLEMALKQVTSLEEILRVTQEIEEEV